MMRTAGAAVFAAVALFVMLYLSLGREPEAAPACACDLEPCRTIEFLLDTETPTRVRCLLPDDGQPCLCGEVRT